uniref:phenylalanine--tRNA ligase n=1 Tax=Schimmelmannia schousboei TaxID=173468 RepID=A0A1C9C8X4_9FLOR|nr:phenylalanyl-tRNA synthetase beta chain [Schimmelmannia schousboei]AOM64828.1 phenylalanyl-tRNA synthetase beta chain [Schimmelmannia schousboei]
MKFSWKWINELVDLQNVTLLELANKLTLAGFEIENIEKCQSIQDHIIDLTITANRQEASCMVGLAREVSTVFNRKLIQDVHLSNDNINNNTDTNISHNYQNNYFKESQSLLNIRLQTIKSLKNNISPEWLQNYLIGCNIKPVNILSDIQEYINIKWGQDIEIFDASKIDNNLIQCSLMTVKNSQQIILNKNIEAEILQYKNKLISTLGIESNPNIMCDLNTSEIIICGTICNPEYINRITKQIKLNTEKSNKHLKKILRCDFLNAYNETYELIKKLLQGIHIETHEYHKLLENKISSLQVSKNNIQNVLGPIISQGNKFLSVQTILKILTQLNFKPIYKNKIFYLIIPKYRQNDIKRPIDVIEEIGRIYGFDKFSNRLPQLQKQGHISKQSIIIYKIRKILRDLGLQEVINYSLTNTNILKQNATQQISLYNPLLEDQSRLRNNLVHNLIINKEYNFKQKNMYFESFEIGKIFNSSSNINKQLSTENTHIAGIMGNINYLRQSWSTKPQQLTWFHAKGILEEVFDKLKANVTWKQYNLSDKILFVDNVKNFFNPKRTAIIINAITKKPIGIFGEVNYQMNHKTIQFESTYIFEIHLNELITSIQSNNHLTYLLRSYSIYPSVTRDICMTLYKDTSIEYIIIKIKKTAPKNTRIESINIFNEYYNKSLKSRNIGIRIKYQANDRTLNKEEINSIDNNIIDLLKSHS